MSEEVDPFEERNLRISQFIMTCRVYDVLMALLSEANAAVASDLLEMHYNSNLLHSQPSFNGNFITDLVNEDVSVSE